MNLNITDIQRFCMHDGNGVRTTVFFKGCPLRCAWCHNPETQNAAPQLMYYASKCIGCRLCTVCRNGAHSFESGHSFNAVSCKNCGACAAICPTKALEIVGERTDADRVIATVLRDADFYGTEGGVTLSGGEPTMQPEAAIYILKELKKGGINTAVETCGYFDAAILPELVKYTDTFLWDIKDTNDARHREYTGVSNKTIIENLFIADEMGAKTVLRCILVNGVNSDNGHYTAIAEIYKRLKNCVRVDILPYHAYGGAKSEALGMRGGNSADGWIPSAETVLKAKEKLK